MVDEGWYQLTTVLNFGVCTGSQRWAWALEKLLRNLRLAQIWHHCISNGLKRIETPHSFKLRGSDGRAQTQGVSQSATVAAGRDQLAWGKHATTVPLLLYWLSSRANKGLILCKFRAATSHFFFYMRNELNEISIESARSCCRPRPRPWLC